MVRGAKDGAGITCNPGGGFQSKADYRSKGRVASVGAATECSGALMMLSRSAVEDFISLARGAVGGRGC